MAKIKDTKKQADKVQRPSTQPLTHISFSFKYITTNKDHNFSYFQKNLRKSLTAYEALFSKLNELCRVNMNRAKEMGKIQGCEPIPYKELPKPMQQICDATGIITRDSSLSVFRFSQNDYRLLCKTDINHPNLLHIIAFDFDFSAYNHGQ